VHDRNLRGGRPPAGDGGHCEGRLTAAREGSPKNLTGLEARRDNVLRFRTLPGERHIVMAQHPLFELSRDRLVVLAEFADQAIRAWTVGCRFLLERVENCVVPGPLEYQDGDLRAAGRRVEGAMMHLRPAFDLDLSICWHVGKAFFFPLDHEVER